MTQKENKPTNKEKIKNDLNPLKLTGEQNRRLMAAYKMKIAHLGKDLSRLVQRNTNTQHINYKIHYLLCDPFTFANAYAKISKNVGALTPGANDDEIMAFFGKANAIELANKFKNKNYKWKPARRTWIPKPGKKKLRPLDTPTQGDRIVQEAIRGILEAIYEPEFTEFEKGNNFRCTNYGFRRNKSTWNAIDNLKYKGGGTTYAIEGDIAGAYNAVNHQKLINILKRRIRDRDFIEVIRQMLRSGIMDKGSYQHSLTGTPQGGIVSPLLFNIYMFEFDKYIWNDVMHRITGDQEGRTSILHPKSRELQRAIAKTKKHMREARQNKTLQKTLKKQLKTQLGKRFTIPSHIPTSIPKRAIYARYADDWVLLFTGTKTEAERIKTEITNHIKESLHMELSSEKTLISKTSEGFNFLGFTYKAETPGATKITKIIRWKYRGNNSRLHRILKKTTSRAIYILPDKARLTRNLLLRGYCKHKKGILTPIGNAKYSLLTPYEIVMHYAQILRGVYNYYGKVDRVRFIDYVFYLLHYSCAKTLARRQHLSMSKIFTKYGKTVRVSTEVHQKGKKVTKRIELPTFANIRKQVPKTHVVGDPDPFNIMNFWRTSFKIYTNCCICNSTDGVAMHHLNSLTNLKRKKRKDRYEIIRVQLQRKQIPVCKQCHLDITHGKYDLENPVKLYNEFIAKL